MDVLQSITSCFTGEDNQGINSKETLGQKKYVGFRFPDPT